VAEDERAVERTSDEAGERPVTDESATGEARPSTVDGAAAGDERTPDDAAETFLELDDDLDLTPEPDVAGGPRRGGRPGKSAPRVRRPVPARRSWLRTQKNVACS